MSKPIPISFPSGYAPGYALGYADPDRNVVLVDEQDRLPVALAAPSPAPLEGQAAVSGESGPFAAVPGRVVLVELNGTWDGSVRLLRSVDGGATRSPLRVAGEPWAVFTANGCEQAWLETEAGASFYLEIALDSGSVTYRVSQ